LFVDGCMGFRGALHGVLATTSTTWIGKSVQIRVAGQNKFRNTSPPRIFNWASLIFDSGRERDEILVYNDMVSLDTCHVGSQNEFRKTSPHKYFDWSVINI
jgi:hypothetical protein